MKQGKAKRHNYFTKKYHSKKARHVAWELIREAVKKERAGRKQ